MNDKLRKMLLRSIRSSLGRYLAILAIVALGVGFFAGLKSSEPAMRGTADDYLQQQRMYDFQLMSSLGITEEDVDAFKALDYISHGEGSYSLTALVGGGEEQEAFQFLSLTQEVCVPVLLEGRMPTNSRECLGDSLVFDASDIGKEITLSPDNEEDTRDLLRHERYTLVGIAKTPRYISAQRGSTHLGSGSIRGFLLLREDGFDSEAFHELLLVSSKLPYTAFTEEYNRARDEVEEWVKTFFNKRGALRYGELRAEADQELLDARAELDDGWQEYEDGKKEAEEELEAAAKELNDSQYQVDMGLEQVAAGEAEIEKAYQDIPAGIAAMKEQMESLAAQKTQVEDGLAVLQAQKEAGLGPLQAQLEQLKNNGGSEADIAAAEQALEQAAAAFAAQEAELQGNLAQLAGGMSYLENEIQNMENAYAFLPAQQVQLDAARAELQSAQAQINEGWADYHEGVAEMKQELADALRELEDGEQELLDARAELEDKLQLDLYTLSRDENSGCATFKNDVSIVDAIADVFPVFFALIAALVCSTTMTRMVTEERTQIGTLKAMGYSSGAIMSKYLLYAGSSAFFGCVLGFGLGVTVIPYIVWKAYGILYDYARLRFYYSPAMCLACMAVAVLGTVLVTGWACRRELAAKPAELIRPKVEGKGKRVFLEHIRPLWKRLSFLNKVTIRNALRYKARVAMMLLGIGGCTALLVTGFGVRDSVVNVLGDQYEKIFLYDLSVNYEPEDFSAQSELEKLWQGQCSHALTYQTEVTLSNAVDEKTARLIAAEPGTLTGMIALFDEGGSIPDPKTGEAVITTRLAQQLQLQPGDRLRVQSDEGLDRELVIAAICENYVGNYLYVNPETVGGPAPNTAFLKVAEGVDGEKLGAALRSRDGVSYVSILAHEQEMMEESMASLDLVVLLLIVCSGALAFITLYNLTNINILERVREVATVKVLGFYPRETASYILRENGMLSFLGAVVGLGLGKLFHRFVIGLLQVEGMCFGDEIAPLSYLLGFGMTLLFAWLCNLAMHGKLEQINMAESLKSVE